jgi:hypothetical protein
MTFNGLHGVISHEIEVFKLIDVRAGIAQSVTRLATGLTTKGSEFESWWGKKFPLLHVVQTGPGAHVAFYQIGIGGSFPGGKAAGA